MPQEFDLKDWNSSDDPEEYYEEYYVDVDNERLEEILEGSVGRIEIHGGLVTRYLPQCAAKAAIPFFLVGKWSSFLLPRYKVTSGTHGILYEGGTLLSTCMNLFDRQSRRASPENDQHMMLPGYPAQNLCLEIEFERYANQVNKGFNRVNNLFSYSGGNGTQIEEIWLLVYPRDDEELLKVANPPDPLPVVPLTQDRPVRESKYIAVFVRTLDPEGDIHYVDDAERPLLIGYYMIQPNMVFQIPSCSLLHGAPNIFTNELLDEMGYRIQYQE